MDAGGGDRTRTCTGLSLNGFLDRGSTNYAYSSIWSPGVISAVTIASFYPPKGTEKLYRFRSLMESADWSGVTGGTRIHDNQSHNLVFYQLNYGHMADAAGFEPADPL